MDVCPITLMTCRSAIKRPSEKTLALQSIRTTVVARGRRVRLSSVRVPMNWNRKQQCIHRAVVASQNPMNVLLTLMGPSIPPAWI